MPDQQNKWVTRFFEWRYKNISHKTFTHIMSVVVGLLAGLAKGIFISNNGLYFILPIIGPTLVYLYVKYVHKERLRLAVSSILFSLSKEKGVISPRQIISRLITAPLTVGFGGSTGLLGPAVASGAAISSYLGKLLRINAKTRSLLIACASAGATSSIFQAPIAGIIFAVEVFSLDLTMLSMLPLFLASISSLITKTPSTTPFTPENWRKPIVF